VLRSRLGSATSGTDLTDAFAVALGDPSATLAYWIDDELGWVSAAGRAASLRPGDIEVTRDTKPVARLRIGAGTDARLATTLLNEASTELDNVRLRAVVAVQLEEVRASRARIVAAQADELLAAAAAGRLVLLTDCWSIPELRSRGARFAPLTAVEGRSFLWAKGPRATLARLLPADPPRESARARAPEPVETRGLRRAPPRERRGSQGLRRPEARPRNARRGAVRPRPIR
jgi:hypothetical protein